MTRWLNLPISIDRAWLQVVKAELFVYSPNAQLFERGN